MEDGYLWKILESYEAELREPISTRYHSLDVYEQPPMSQGFLLLEMLNIVEESGINANDWPAEIIHKMVEAKKAAFTDRINEFGDSNRIDSWVNEIISKTHASKISRLDYRILHLIGFKFQLVRKTRDPTLLIFAWPTPWEIAFHSSRVFSIHSDPAL